MNFVLFTVIKDEQQYLEEWLQYHLNLGIEKIFVYEDVFSSSHKDICDKFPDKVICTSVLSLYSEKEYEKIQSLKKNNRAFAGFQLQYLYKVLDYIQSLNIADWVFYLDVDEFLTLKSKRSTLNSVFKNFNSYDIVVLQWMNYNANGNIIKPTKSTVDSYTQECQLYIGKMMHPKASSKLAFNISKWDPDKIKTNHHIPKQANWCKTNFSTDPLEVVYDKIYIRHYITKSFEEYCNKLYIRGQIIPVHTLNDFFIFNPDIPRDNSDVQSILKKYSDMYRSGELTLF